MEFRELTIAELELIGKLGDRGVLRPEVSTAVEDGAVPLSVAFVEQRSQGGAYDHFTIALVDIPEPGGESELLVGATKKADGDSHDEEIARNIALDRAVRIPVEPCPRV